MNKPLRALFCIAVLLLCWITFGASGEDDHLYAAQEGDLYGYINRAGAWVVPPKYYYADDFMPCGLAVVSETVEAVCSGALTANLIDKTGAAIVSFGDWKVELDDPDRMVVSRKDLLLLSRATENLRRYALYFADTGRWVEMNADFLTAACPHPSMDWMQHDALMELADIWQDRIVLKVFSSKPSLYGFILLDWAGNPVAHRWDISHFTTSCTDSGEYMLYQVKGAACSIMDKDGNDIAANLSYGAWLRDGAVIDLERNKAMILPDGEEVDYMVWAQKQAQESKWGVYPTSEGICLDERRSLNPKLAQISEDFSGFCADGLAWVANEDTYSYDLINTNCDVLAPRLMPYTQSDSYPIDPPAFSDGWMCVSQLTNDTVSDYGYVSPDGHFLLDCLPFSVANEFADGLAYVGITAKDYTLVNAYIDPSGHVVWAENDRKTEIQDILDNHAVPRMSDMTAEDAARILSGEWDCSGGGEHLGYPVKFDDDGTWKVIPYDPARDDYWGEPPFELLFKDDETGEFMYGIGLDFYNGDTFTVRDYQGGSGYIRMPKGYWDDCK